VPTCAASHECVCLVAHDDLPDADSATDQAPKELGLLVQEGAAGTNGGPSGS